MFLVIFLFLLTLVLSIYFYIQSVITYWERKGIPHVKSDFFKNLRHNFKSEISFHDATIQHYENLKQYPYGGVYDDFKAKLFVLDPELIKNVFVRDFEHFTDRSWDRFQVEDFLQNILLWIKGNHWKKVRVILTPAFTSGKLKAMESLIVDCANQAVENLESRTKEQVQNEEIELKMFFSQYTLDVICSCAFGIEINSMKDKDSELVQVLHNFQYRSVFERIKILISFTVLPNFLRKFVRLWFINKKTAYVMKNVILDSVTYRRKNNKRRNDFLQLMLDIAEEEKQNGVKNPIMDDMTIIANSILFMLAGFETTSTVLAFTGYELTLNPDIQDRVREEINSVLEKHKNQLNYDSLKEMKYLDMVINESMRLHPSISRTNRVCTKPYKLPNHDFVIQPGQLVTCPVVGLHYDPKYFPDPEKFDPERFHPDKLNLISSYSFLPFGVGSRNCIGKRFGMMSAKIILSTLLSKYKFLKTDRTKVPCDLEEEGVFLKPKYGLFVKIVPIIKNGTN